MKIQSREKYLDHNTAPVPGFQGNITNITAVFYLIVKTGTEPSSINTVTGIFNLLHASFSTTHFVYNLYIIPFLTIFFLHENFPKLHLHKRNCSSPLVLIIEVLM